MPVQPPMPSRVRRPIHQVLVGASGGDAITGMAIQIRDQLRQDRVSEIYAHFLDPSAASEVHPIAAIPPGRARELLIYHASYGTPEVTSLLRNRPERLVLAYHNITPSRHFVDHAPHFALGLEWGRHELRLLREQVVLSIADSQFNAQDLAEQGYDDVHVIPAGLRPNRLRSVPPEPGLARELHSAFPNGYATSDSPKTRAKVRHSVGGNMVTSSWT